MNNRLQYLDSTRGVAAFTVLLSHFFGAFVYEGDMAKWNHSILHSLWHGKGAVSYFFVLSGLVLSYTYFQNEEKLKHFNYLDFIIKRVLRIYPVFLAVILLSFIAINFFFNPDSIKSLAPATDWIKMFWLNKTSFISMFKESLLIVRIPQEPELRLINQDWTLTIELIVSVLVPPLIVITKRSSWMLVIVVLVLLRMHTLHWIVEFAAGVWISANLHQIRNFFGRINFITKFLLLTIALILYTLEFMIDMPEIFSIFLTKLSVVLILILVLCLKRLQNILSIPVLVFLGEISYCLYLCHFIVILVVAPEIFNWLKYNQLTDNFMVTTIVLMVTILCSLLLAYLLSIIIERPFVSLSRKLSKMIRKNRESII
ncbi:MAG: acyltransferase [Bacteroidota bacterium]